MTCPHDNISLPTSADPDTVCADCGAVLTDEEIRQLPPRNIFQNYSIPPVDTSAECRYTVWTAGQFVLLNTTG